MLLVGIVGVLTMVPGEFRLEGEGKVQPETRREVFAEEEGMVVGDIPEHGHRVEKGDPLIEMINFDLQNRLAKAESDLKKAKIDLEAKEAQRNTTGLTQDEATQLAGQIATLRGSLPSLESDVVRLNKRKKRTFGPPHRSAALSRPGIFASGWKIAPCNGGRCCSALPRIKVLGCWRLKSPEDRIGHVLRAKQEQEKSSPRSTIGSRLRVGNKS